jgi:hypothetical protein
MEQIAGSEERQLLRTLGLVAGLALAVVVAGCSEIREQVGPIVPSSIDPGHTLPGGANVRSFDTATCNVATNTFTSGTEVCAKPTGLGNGFVGTLEWLRPDATVARSIPVNTNGSIQDRFTPDACGTWTLRLTHPRDGGGADVLTWNFDVTNCVAEACSPGFWRQPHHFDEYPNPPAPSDTFGSVFGRVITVDQNPDPAVTNPTLAQAAAATGGGVNRIARIGTAAYLSAVHADVAYPYTPAEVILAVQQAIDGVAFTGPSIDDLENVWKDVVDHCPLGDDPDEG